MGGLRASGKKGYSSGDWNRRISESSVSRECRSQSRKESCVLGSGSADGV